jgi:hypothetical protein
LTACAVVANNQRVFRRLTAVALALLVPIGAVTVPLLHVHLDVHDTDHHQGRAMHGHIAGHEHRVPAVAHRTGIEEPGDERTLTPTLFVAVSSTAFALPAVTPARLVLAPLPERAAHLILHVAHGHDPPLSRSISPRAPPASLSS